MDLEVVAVREDGVSERLLLSRGTLRVYLILRRRPQDGLSDPTPHPRPWVPVRHFHTLLGS